MPQIYLPEGLRGIVSGFAFRRETAKPMRELAHILLHGLSTLSLGERELIATFVSSQTTATSARRATEQLQPPTLATQASWNK